MILYSTKHQSKPASLEKAVLKGLAEDGGLYMPEKIPQLTANFFENISKLSFQEIAFIVSKALIGEDIGDNDLKKIINQAIDFDAPLVKLEDKIYSLELFHGPTLAFKDFGARFMSRLMGHFLKEKNQQTLILAATSGDTGSAVAHGFFQVPNIKVAILYPSGKVSHLQEQQMTTMGGNITAFEVNGSFDDCQAMVKAAFMDQTLHKLNLSSANSINISRLIPQTFYYFYAYAQLQKQGVRKAPIFSVPSGNFGNLTAGVIAHKMGLPVSKFIAATNANDTFPIFMRTGNYQPKPSVKTIANAMDVGAPSNFARLLDIFGSKEEMEKMIWSQSFSDQEITACIKKVRSEDGYTLDPHGAVAYLGIKAYNQDDTASILLETAHPAKFLDVEIPERLAKYAKLEKKSIKIGNSIQDLKKALI